MSQSAEKDALALQVVILDWEQNGVSNELLGSPADCYAQAEHILASHWFYERMAQAYDEGWNAYFEWDRDATLPDDVANPYRVNPPVEGQS